MLSPYQLGTLRIRTMSLPELDPCQAEHTEITCFSSGTKSKYKKGGVLQHAQIAGSPELSEQSSPPSSVALRDGRMKTQAMTGQSTLA